MLEHETVELFNLITQNTNLIEFTNKVQQHIFNNPVMITNSYFKVIGMSSDIEFKDAVWDYAKKNHCCSKESIISFRNDKASKLFSHKTNLFYIKQIHVKHTSYSWTNCTKQYCLWIPYRIRSDS